MSFFRTPLIGPIMDVGGDIIVGIPQFATHQMRWTHRLCDGIPFPIADSPVVVVLHRHIFVASVPSLASKSVPVTSHDANRISRAFTRTLVR